MVHKSPKESPNKPIIDRYRLLNFLNRGKNKSTYRAIDIHTARPVALKLLQLDQGQEDKQLRVQFFRKCMEEVAALNYPHILPVLDFGKMTNEQEQKNDFVYIVTPLAAERSLDIWLNNYWQQQKDLTRQLALPDIRQFVSQAAESLQYAHDQKVLHLGLKQTNFLIPYQKDGKQFPQLEMSDFSIARFSALPQQIASDPEASYALAPELLQGQPVAASDQYALAAMTYELLTGNIYIPHRHDKTSTRVLFSPDEQASRLDPAVHEVLQRALSTQSQARYPSVAEFAKEFEYAMRQGEPGEHTYIMLGVSQAEALMGASYSLAMADKQRVTVDIPPNAQAGEVIKIPNAGKPSQFGGTRGSLIATLAIRPNPDENRQVVEQLQQLASKVQTLQTQPPARLQKQIETLDEKVTAILQTQEDEEVTLKSVEDLPRFLVKHVPPSLAIGFTVLMIIVILGNCILSGTLKGAIIANGSSNTQGIISANAQIAATASALTHATATTTASVQATATANQTIALQNALDSQTIPPQYQVPATNNTTLLINDLTDVSSTSRWSQQTPTNDQACYFDQKDTLYHAKMTFMSSSAYFCQMTLGVITTGPTFVMQVRMNIMNGDAGGMVFNIMGKSFCYFYINQAGQYEVGINGTPFSSGKGQSNAINKGTGLGVSNLLGVVVNNNTLTFYANLQPIFSVPAVPISTQGTVAFVARSDGSPTNVAYQKVKIWRY